MQCTEVLYGCTEQLTSTNPPLAASASALVSPGRLEVWRLPSRRGGAQVLEERGEANHGQGQAVGVVVSFSSDSSGAL